MAESPAARAAILADAARAGDRLALARLLTAVENHTPVAEHAVRRLYPLAGRAHLIGITGPPGAGKSTLIGSLVAHQRKPVARPGGLGEGLGARRRGLGHDRRPTRATRAGSRWRG